ncbi:MAG: ferric iron uptake transcriptional regulator [Pseudomonadota bacterium]
MTQAEPMNQRDNGSANLRAAGLKVTLPRLRVLEVMEKSDRRHMSAEDVYRKLIESDAEVGLATVYRVLTQFESAGLVYRRHFDGGQALFELNDEDNHSHVVCLKTGHVEEFSDPVIEDRLREISKELGYSMVDHTIVVHGIHKSAK